MNWDDILKLFNKNAGEENQLKLEPTQGSYLADTPLGQLLSQQSETEAVEQVEANPDEPKAELTNAAKNPFDLNIPSANTVPSSFDVSSGLQPSTVKMEGQVGDITPPPSPAAIPPMPPDVQTESQIAPEAPQMAPEPRKEGSKGRGEKNPLDTILEGTDNKDYEARQQFEESERKKRGLSAIPMGLAGVADAISNAASAFGAKGTTGSMERTQATLLHGEKLRKDQFDQKLLTDPNSEISQHYRNTLAMMMSTKPTDPKIAHLSAAQIDKTLPEVEKFITHQLQRELVKSQKDLAVSEKQSQFDERRWERLGSAVNQMTAGSRKALGVAAGANMRADRLLQTAKDPNATPQDVQNMIADLQGVYKGGVPDQIMLQHGNYPTLVQELQKIRGFITNTPAAAKSPEIINRLEKVTREIKAVDNKVISDNLGVNEVVFKELIQKDPARWEALKNRVMEGTEAVGEEGSSKLPETKAGEMPKVKQEIPTVTSQQEYDALPSGAQYKDANGKTYRKK